MRSMKQMAEIEISLAKDRKTRIGDYLRKILAYLNGYKPENRKHLLNFVLIIPTILEEIISTGGRVLEVLIAITPFLSEANRSRLTKIVSVGGMVHLTASVLSSILNTVSQYLSKSENNAVEEGSLSAVAAKHGWNDQYVYVEADEFISMNLFFKYLLKEFDILEVYGKSEGKGGDIDFFHACVASGSEYLPSMILLLRGKRGTAHSGVKFAVNVSYRGDHIDIIGEYRNIKELEDFIHQLIAEYIDSFKGTMFNLKTKYSGTTSLSISTVCCERPKHFDANVLNKLETLCSRAIEKSDKLSILLYGPPGVGKTSMLNELVSRMDALVFNIEYTPPDSLVAFLQRIKTPKILIMEELDADDPEGADDKTERIAKILKLLDSSSFSIAIMTVNSTDLHPALVRSGRADLKVLFDLPDKDMRHSIIRELHYEYYGSFPKYDTLKTLIKATVGFSHADISTLYRLSDLHGVDVSVYLSSFLEDRKRFNEFEHNDNV